MTTEYQKLLEDYTVTFEEIDEYITLKASQGIEVKTASTEDILETLYPKVIIPIKERSAQADNTLANLLATIFGGIGKSLLGIGETVADFLTKPGNLISQVIDGFISVASSLASSVIQGISPFINTIITTFDSLAAHVKSWIGDRVSELVAIVEGLYTTFMGSLAWLGDQIGIALKDGIASLLPGIAKIPAEIETTRGEVKSSGIIGFISKITTTLNEALTKLDELGDTEEGSVATEARRQLIGLYSYIGMFTGSPMGLLPVIGEIYSAGLGEIIRHDTLQVYQPTLLPAPVAVEARYRELIDSKFLSHDMVRQGFSTIRSDVLEKLYLKLLDIDTLRLLYLRGEIDSDRLSSELAKQGYQLDDIKDIKKLFQLIPGVQDLIRMGVREAWRDDVAERYGYDEDYPLELSDWAKKQGLSDEWCKRYWRAHWELPGPAMAREMLWRTSMTIEDYETLLRIGDYPKAFRDWMVEVAYNPFTRVDVRRMHKLGVLSEEELVKSYMDIGYTQEKATKLAEFTIIYNQDPEETELTEGDKRKAKDRDLTKADLLKGYHDNLLPRQEVSQALKDIGYSDDEAEFYVMREDFLIEQELTNQYLDIYKAAYLKGTVDYNRLVDSLNELGIPTEQAKTLLIRWSIERSLKVSKPTKSELLGWYKRKLINADDCASELRGLGYDDKYVDLYMTMKTGVSE